MTLEHIQLDRLKISIFLRVLRLGISDLLSRMKTGRWADKHRIKSLSASLSPAFKSRHEYSSPILIKRIFIYEQSLSLLQEHVWLILAVWDDLLDIKALSSAPVGCLALEQRLPAGRVDPANMLSLYTSHIYVGYIWVSVYAIPCNIQ